MYKKKSLGQHFLRSASYVKAVADAASLAPGECVLEIGPGEGVLTQELLNRGATVVAIEKDARLIPLLAEKFAAEIAASKLKLVEADILEIDIDTLGLPNKSYKLVANIPYYITGAILKKFLSGTPQPTLAVLLVQKEVAERIARAPKESILSLSVKAYGAAKYVKTVPSGAFAPAPSVDSAILLIDNISRANFKNAAHEQKFFEVVKAGFAQKRKLLKRNLEAVLGQDALTQMQKASVPENARAEDVALLTWLTLAE